ncbi:glutamate ABC transporter substrate-binding protein [Nocardia callitridis]|uniref:Glutamate ABC transporter substrate-binding protein n=1 Tax=Nocardia callitridis TaxID=648753 RepID=A0ABP9JUF8_9NOCA
MSKSVLRRALPLAILTATTLFATACGGSTLPQVNGQGGIDHDAYEQAIDNAPVAAPADIPEGSLMAAIKARGELVVGGTDTAAVFSLTDPTTGKTTGFDAGLAAMLAKYITGETAVKLVQVQVANREALLQTGAVDSVIATYTINPKRAQLVAFAGPYYSSGDAILVKKDDIAIKTVDDLNGKKVCTESSSTAAQEVRRFAPGAELVLFDSNAQCTLAVEQGRADAYVLDEALLLGNASRQPDKVKVVGQPFTDEPYGIGLSLEHPEMKAFVNDWLKKIQADGSWAALWESTVGTIVDGRAPTAPVIGSVDGS